MKTLAKNIAFLVAGAFLSSPAPSFAETIDGPAHLRDKPGGKIVGTLENGVTLDAVTDDNEEWAYLVVEGWVKKADLPDARGDGGIFDVFTTQKLSDDNGRLKATVLKGYYAQALNDSTGGADGFYKIVVGGYTHRKNIVDSTGLEFQLSRLLTAKKTHVSQYRAHMSRYGYQEWEDKGLWKTWHKGAPPWIGGVGVRILLAFRQDTLRAIVGERLSRSFPQRKLEKIDRYQVMFTSGGPGIKREFRELYSENFRHAE